MEAQLPCDTRHDYREGEMKKVPKTVYNALDELAEDILNIPISELAKHANDPRMLALIIGVAFNQGIQLGRNQTHTGYNRMFKGYTEETIKS